MLLGETLSERNRILDRIGMLGTRLAENAILEEGGRPAEASDALLEELRHAVSELEALSQRAVSSALFSTTALGTSAFPG